MINFIDTNVLIGYCILADNWHDQCSIIDKTANIWLSDKVLKEWSKREDKIIRERESLLLRHRQETRKRFRDTIEPDHRDRLINSVPENIKQFMTRFYLEQISYPISKDELCNQIDCLISNLKFEKISRFACLVGRCQSHIRSSEYPQENSFLKPCVHNGDGDRGIVLDAHDLILSKPCEKLRLLTLDNKLSDECKEKILKYLKISEIKDLKYCPPSMYHTS